VFADWLIGPGQKSGRLSNYTAKPSRRYFRPPAMQATILTASARQLTSRSCKWSWSTIHVKLSPKLKMLLLRTVRGILRSKLTNKIDRCKFCWTWLRENGQNRCIAYATRSLTRWKEALTAVCICERFHL
jgi:hypothetical protein